MVDERGEIKRLDAYLVQPRVRRRVRRRFLLLGGQLLLPGDDQILSERPGPHELGRGFFLALISPDVPDVSDARRSAVIERRITSRVYRVEGGV